MLAPRLRPLGPLVSLLAVGGGALLLGCSLSTDLDLLKGGDAGPSSGGSSGSGGSAGSGGGADSGVTPASAPFRRIAAGGNHACVIDGTSRVYCWGSNQFGQLGLPGVSSTTTPTLVPGVQNVTNVVAGNFHTCAFGESGNFCWGQGNQGELGDGEVKSSPTPVAVTIPGLVTSAAAGAAHTCVAFGADRELSCWGSNTNFQSSSTGDPSNVPTPTPTGLTGQFSIATGAKHTCASPSVGKARCWGAGDLGQLGTGSTSDSASPVDVELSVDATQLASRAGHTCAIVKGQDLYCWGWNSAGQLGLGSSGGQEPTPTLVGGNLNPLRIATGNDHTCAIQTGTAYCWGGNANGQLGLGDTGDSNLPKQIALPSGLVVFDIALGISFSCALVLPQGGSEADAIWCWGNNTNGQVGTENSAAEPSPVKVQL